MAQRPIWRGHLRLALVSCPVALYSARHDRNTVRFNMINPETGNRIKMVSLDAGTEKEISRRDIVKGFEFKKDHYVLLSDEDFDSVKVDSSSTMMVEKFVDAGSIDPIYYDSSYYLAPDGKGSEDVYAVLREAVKKTGKVALTRVVISQRERTVAIRPLAGGLAVHTLNEERDLNSAKTLFEGVEGIKVDLEMVKLAVQLVDRQAGRYDPADLEDRYETRLRAMIDAKVKGEGISPEEELQPRVSNVVDLMAALKRSLGQSATAKPASDPQAAEPTKTPRKAKASAAEELRRQPAFKLPIEGGQKTRSTRSPAEPVKAEVGEKSSRPRRKA